jgi:AcrR family transcriptional regulator
MPAPARTSIDTIVRAAADLLEANGPAGLSMQAVAARVGVRAPSLYKHVAGRAVLVRLVAEDAARDIGRRVDAAAPPGMPPRAALGAAVRALRSFGRERPAAFRLVFSPGDELARPDPEVLRRAAATVLRIGTELAGPERALEAARTLTAWASGFVCMELADAFRMGGDVDEAFDFGVERLAAALAG